jgi:hypothetical protein
VSVIAASEKNAATRHASSNREIWLMECAAPGVHPARARPLLRQVMSGIRRSKSERAGPHNARRGAPSGAGDSESPVRKLSISMVGSLFAD